MVTGPGLLVCIGDKIDKVGVRVGIMIKKGMYENILEGWALVLAM